MAGDRLYNEMMQRAIRLARRAEGRTSPNPMVGAVIFDRDGVIATGYHKKAGGPHAEIVALHKAGEKARGASIAINLEPCCHTGRTGPCTQALIEAGIAVVIYSVDDPFAEVCGRGRAILQEHGIRVVTGVGEEAARRLNEVYFHYHTCGRPFVVVKTAQSLDGRIATSTGDSRWITGPEARSFAHKLRARYDAVAIGAGTARTDNPQLTVRHVKGNNPLRIVVTTSASLPSDLELFTDNDDGKTVVATTDEVIATGAYRKVTAWALLRSDEGIDVAELLAEAARRGIMSILVEGGAGLITSLMRRKLVDKYYQFMAPLLIGDGLNAIGDIGIAKMSQAVHFANCGVRKTGSDWLFWGYPGR